MVTTASNNTKGHVPSHTENMNVVKKLQGNQEEKKLTTLFFLVTDYVVWTEACSDFFETYD